MHAANIMPQECDEKIDSARSYSQVAHVCCRARSQAYEYHYRFPPFVTTAWEQLSPLSVRAESKTVRA
jgi:hypothetical protein